MAEQAAAPSRRNLCSIGSLILGQKAKAFSRILIREHLDGESRLALYRACKSARQEVLITAPRAACCVGIEMENNAHLHLAQVKAGLITRGTEPVKIKLGWPCREVLGVLEGAGAGVHELTIAVPEDTVVRTVPASLGAAAGQSFPNLKSLAFENLNVVIMPPPSLLPHLTALNLHKQDESGAVKATKRTFRSIAPYLTQLTHLRFQIEDSIVDPAVDIATLFSSTVSHSLRSLTLSCVLTDTFLGLVLTYAPALEVLSVWDTELESDVHAHTPCRWRQLTCTSEVDVRSLACLPSSPEGARLVLDTWSLSCQAITEEVEAAAVQAATRMELQIKDVPLVIKPGLPGGAFIPVADEPAALRAALNVVRAFTTQAPPQTLGVELDASNAWSRDHWTISAPLMRQLQRLPEWGRFKFGHVRWLPEAPLYAALLRHLPDSYHEIAVGKDKGSIFSEAHLKCMCLAMPGQGQGRQQPLHVNVIEAKEGVVESVQLSLAQLGAAEQVVVTRG